MTTQRFKARYEMFSRRPNKPSGKCSAAGLLIINGTEDKQSACAEVADSHPRHLRLLDRYIPGRPERWQLNLQRQPPLRLRLEELPLRLCAIEGRAYPVPLLLQQGPHSTRVVPPRDNNL